MLSYKDRDFHDLAINRYKNIWHAKDVEEFKQVFLDCVECHFHAYNTGGVLHRDISENNLMIYQLDETDRDNSTSATDPEAVVLNDDGTIASGSISQQHITGTLPFMACGLLRRLAWPDEVILIKYQAYRYDLEAFFYILIWAATCYDLGSGARLPLPSKSHLQHWLSPQPKMAHYAKLDLFGHFKALESDIRPEWKGHGKTGLYLSATCLPTDLPN